MGSTAMSGTNANSLPATAAIPFPSAAWFEQLMALMNNNRARQEQLGYVDCVAQFTVLDGGPDGGPVAWRVRFEEFEAIGLEEVAGADLGDADFALEATLATWQEMIANIAANGGRPDLDHSLNRLSHMGTPLKLRGADAVRSDCFFRFNQSLQEFVNASASFQSIFP